MLTGQAAGEMMTFTAFDPKEGALRAMVTDDAGPSVAKAIASFFPVPPKDATPELLQGLLSGGDETHVASYSAGPSFAGAVCTEDVIRVAIRGQPPLATAPDLFICNIADGWIHHWDAGRRTWKRPVEPPSPPAWWRAMTDPPAPGLSP